MTTTEIALVPLSALLHASWNTATKGSESPTAFLLNPPSIPRHRVPGLRRAWGDLSAAWKGNRAVEIANLSSMNEAQVRLTQLTRKGG